RKPGIYLTWDECKAQVNKFPNAVYKKFSTHTKAQNFNEEKHEVSVVLNDSKIQIWTDGSSFNNSTKKAQADNDPNNLSERLPGSEQTNNRAEIYAVIHALEICENKTKPLEIITDSKYVISIIEDWIERWEKNRYMSYNNKLIKNQDLIKRLKKLIDNRIGTVRLVYVRGHLGNYENEQADRLAKHGSLREAVAEIFKLENNI
ncbi:31172_t:CDS:2, partial [Racocetra persica]